MKQVKTDHFKIRTSPDYKAKVKKLAAKRGVWMSELFYDLLNTELEKEGLN